MSRLIVKGLPKYYTEDKLREFFGKQGDVTDVKLMKKRNGESRRFAFVGYKSFEDAEKAASFFNKSFIDTARIDVELAKTFSDPNVPMSFKDRKRQNEERLREQEERLLQQEQQQKKRRKNVNTIDDEIAADPKLREFMEVMKPSHQVKSWANDSTADGSGAPSAAALEEALAKQDSGIKEELSQKYEVKQAREVESDDEYDDFVANRKHSEDDEEEMMSLDNLKKPEAEADVEETADIAADENVSDLDWLKSRRIRIRDNEEEKKEESVGEVVEETAESEEHRARPRRQVEIEESLEEVTAAKIAVTGRLFIRNILYTSTEAEFRDLFEQYGPLQEVHIAVDTRTGKSKGFVYVQFENSSDAVQAYEALDKQIFQGRLLHILPGEKKKDHRLDEFDIKNLPLKKQRELKKKSQASF